MYSEVVMLLLILNISMWQKFARNLHGSNVIGSVGIKQNCLWMFSMSRLLRVPLCFFWGNWSQACSYFQVGFLEIFSLKNRNLEEWPLWFRSCLKLKQPQLYSCPMERIRCAFNSFKSYSGYLHFWHLVVDGL